MTGTDLTTTAERPLTLTDCRMSQPLQRLLLELGDRQEAFEVVAQHPHLREEVRATLPMLERTLAPAGPDVVRRALGPLLQVYREALEPSRSSQWWGVYYTALAALPAHAVMQAAEDYPSQPGAEWFPKPAVLKELALKFAGPAYQAVGRARAMMKLRVAA